MGVLIPVVVHAIHHHTSTPLANSPALAHALAPYALHGPYGTVPRVRPLDLAIVLDPSLTLSQESQVEVLTALRHIRSWEMFGDRLGEVGLLPSTVLAQVTRIADTAADPADPTSLRDELASWWAERPTHDHAVVIMTADPENWTNVVNPTSVQFLGEPIAARPPVTRLYVLTPGAFAGNDFALPGADPTYGGYSGRRGSLAQAVADCWINGIGALVAS